ncbi:MAG TPA: hypothetical protein VMP08_17250 [Anaerolineae bacterium]|nr:hypothetical protein [Anaerolineae bacterium]
MTVWIAACGPNNPIDTSNPIDFAPNTQIFSMKVPGSWTQVQNEVPTEYMAAFADPTHRAEMIAYVGLLDHRLTDEEGFKAVSGLIGNLLNHPADMTVTDQQRRADGAFDIKVAFTRNNEKRVGEAVIFDNNLALSGVVSEGPEAFWPDLSNALQPFVKSFQINPENVQGAYFAPVENVGFSFAGPADWSQQNNTAGSILHSPSGQLTIMAMQRPLTSTLDSQALQDLAAQLMTANGVPGKVITSETLPDGRLKVVFDRPKHRVVGYVDQKDQVFAGLFFDVPNDRAADYQPFIDFVYSTFVTGKP